MHTTGINPEGALATASAVVVLLTPVAILLSRSFKRSIKDAIRDEVKRIIADDVTPRFLHIDDSIALLQETQNDHSVKIARLEGVQEGKRQVVTEARLKS